MNNKPVRAVIKYGGHVMDDTELKRAFCKDLVYLIGQKMELVVVHGGGPQIGRMLKALKIESRFENGLRVTDGPTLEIVEMVLCGEVNKAVVRDFGKAGLPAVGISGMDGNLLRASVKNPLLGFVGEIEAVNPGLVQCLLKSNYLPVIAPIALGIDGKPLNINADTAAGAIAGAIDADYFILISDVPGVLDGNGALLASPDWQEVEKLLAEGIISGGMIPKVQACRAALDAGCGKAIIIDGRKESSLRRFLLEGEPFGTLFGHA